MHSIADRRQPSAKVTLASDCRALATAPPFVRRRNLSAAYLFISLTVGADRRETGDNVALQLPSSAEIPKG